MKFWKSLSNLIEEMFPDWRDKFLSYKDLKKQLKLIYPKSDDRPFKRRRSEAAGDSEVAKEVTDFVRLLEDEIEKFNAFFVEMEEDYIIKLKELQVRVEKAKDSNEELLKLTKDIVDLHGEMVLLENYSALNYTGLVKIIKKYDKRSGALIRLPFIQGVLEQPFFTTDVLKSLVKGCVAMLEHFFSPQENNTIPPIGDIEVGDVENVESTHLKLAVSALRVLNEIRSGSSTVSVFSLPPMQSNVVDVAWKASPLVQQEAK